MTHHIAFSAPYFLSVLCLWNSAEVKAYDAANKLTLRGSAPITEFTQVTHNHFVENSWQHSLTRELEQETGLACESNLWHPDPYRYNGCSNSLDFPEEWKGVGVLFYSSSRECCDYFVPGKDCNIYNACVYGTPSSKPTLSNDSPVTPSVSCTSNEWHPDIINQDGCSNSLDFPEEWRGIPRYFYSNSKECCDFFFPKGGCTVHQVCEDGPSPLSSTEPSLKPTPFPTKFPTNEPSTQRPTASSTTRRPSALPTPAPVKSPTRVPTKQYYSVPSSGMCKHVDESTPAWITTFFSDYSDCCKSGWAIEACLAEAPSDENQTVPTTNPTVPPMLYYLISSTGICAPVDAYTPSWMTSADFFSDCRECCKSSWNNEACIAAKPCGTPTFTPTSEAMSQPTRTPTIEPVSTQQMTHNPTSRPAALCHSALWHPSEDFSKCTNSFTYNESWDRSPMSDVYLHETLSGCCEAFFEQWNVACVFEDICTLLVDVKPTGRPTNESSDQTTNHSAETSPCPSALWHPSEDYSMCTNSFGYPEKWNAPSLSSAYLHETAYLCCEMFFFSWGKECVIKDTCIKNEIKTPTNHPTQARTSIPTKSPLSLTGSKSSCTSALWHPSEDYSKCTNSFGYNESWDAPPLISAYLHETVENCCKYFFEAWNQNCVIEDICDLKPFDDTVTISGETSTTGHVCEMKTWHPSSGFTSCTNSDDYPKSWNLPGKRGQYLFDSKERCCEVFFLAQDKSCVVEDSCSGLPSKVPTRLPNGYSTTQSPTTKLLPPTQRPTKTPVSSAPVTSKPSYRAPSTPPSHPPSSRPTEMKWYPDRNPDYSKGRCINTVPIPQFRETYATSRECCDRSYAGQESGACLSSEVTTTSSSVQTSSTTATVRYFSDPSSGMCDVVDGNTPSWITTFFTDWTECCKIGWVLEACLAASPANVVDDSKNVDEVVSKSTTTTSTSSTALTLQYYSDPSSGMCDIVDESTPTWITTYFTDWTECCKSGWVLAACLAAAPANVVADSGTIDAVPNIPIDSTACESALWHPTNDAHPICSNSNAYPSVWNDPALKHMYLLQTAQACCEQFYSGRVCEIVDTCV